MVVEGNIKRFLNGTDENTHNRHFRYIDFPDEPNHDDELELLDELLDVEIDAYVDALIDCDNEAEASRLRNSFNFIIEIAEELGLDASQVLGRISNRILEHHESEPEPENEPMPEPENEPMPEPEPEYDEPIHAPVYNPEKNHLMDDFDDCIYELVNVLTHGFMLNNDDYLRILLTRAFNNEYPPECSDKLRALIDHGRELIDVMEENDYYHLDINDVVDHALFYTNEIRQHPELLF